GDRSSAGRGPSFGSEFVCKNIAKNVVEGARLFTDDQDRSDVHVLTLRRVIYVPRGLKIHPKIGRCAEQLRQPDGRISRHTTATTDNLIQPIKRNSHERGCTHLREAQRNQEFLKEHLSRVRWCAVSRDHRFPLMVHSLLVKIFTSDFARIAPAEHKNDSILVVN